MLLSNQLHAAENKVVRIETDEAIFQTAEKLYQSCDDVFLNLRRENTLRCAVDQPSCDPILSSYKGEKASNCSVSPLNEIGRVGFLTHYKSEYRIELDDWVVNVTGIYVKDGVSDGAKLLYLRRDDANISYINDISIVNNAYGNILAINGCVKGSGVFDASEYFIWSSQDNAWHILKETWPHELHDELHLGEKESVIRYYCEGVNVKEMTATAYIQKDSDKNCCPSGGKLSVILNINNNKLKVKSHELFIGCEDYIIQAEYAKNNGDFDSAEKLAIKASGKAVSDKDKFDVKKFREHLQTEKHIYQSDAFKVKGDYHNALLHANKAVNAATDTESKGAALIKRFELNRGFGKAMAAKFDAKALCNMDITSIFTCLERNGKPTYSCSTIRSCDYSY